MQREKEEDDDNDDDEDDSSDKDNSNDKDDSSDEDETFQTSVETASSHPDMISVMRRAGIKIGRRQKVLRSTAPIWIEQLGRMCPDQDFLLHRRDIVGRYRRCFYSQIGWPNRKRTCIISWAFAFHVLASVLWLGCRGFAAVEVNDLT